MKVADQRLLAVRLRLPALAVSAAAIAVLIVLGVHFAHRFRPGRVDRRIDHWVFTHLSERVARVFLELGSPAAVVVFVVLIVAICLWLRYLRGAVLAVAATGLGSSATEWVIKPAVHRTIRGGLAFPSGHTTGFCAVALTVAVLVCGPGRQLLSRRMAALVCVIAALSALGCMVGLVRAGYHYATDVLGGLCVATAAVLLVALPADAIFASRWAGAISASR